MGVLYTITEIGKIKCYLLRNKKTQTPASPLEMVQRVMGIQALFGEPDLLAQLTNMSRLVQLLCCSQRGAGSYRSSRIIHFKDSDRSRSAQSFGATFLATLRNGFNEHASLSGKSVLYCVCLFC